MSAFDFANKYASKRFFFPKALLPIGVDTNHSICQLVGWIDDTMVVLEPEDPSFRNDHCWPLYDAVTLVIHRQDMYNPQFGLVIAVDYRDLKEPKQDLFIADIFGKSTKKKIIPPKPYPSRCRKCKAPARDSGKLIMCSNDNCSTRKVLITSLDIKPLKTRVIQCNHTSKSGQICKQRAVTVRLISKDIYLLVCEKGHRFQIHINDLKINDVVLLTAIGNDLTDRIWDGKKWDTY